MPEDLQHDPAEISRGREAARPQDVPARGWRDITVRVWRNILANNLFLAASGVTYGMLVSLFPALAALVSLYGLAFNPNQVAQQVNTLSQVLPDQTRQMIIDQLHQLASASNSTLGISAVVATIFTLWTASRGMSALLTALDIAYEQPETRNYVRYNLVALGLTILMLIGVTITLALVAVLPAAVEAMGLGLLTQALVYAVEWPLLIACSLVGMAIVYRYGPDRQDAQWQWVTPGAIIGTALWIIGSIGFTVYVTHFNSYNKTYGSLAGVLILLTWLYLSSFVVLLGAAVNAEAERQTRRDTTTGRPKPMGQRGAHAADTLGPSTG